MLLMKHHGDGSLPTMQISDAFFQRRWAFTALPSWRGSFNKDQ
jgi:hypothetical protein